MKLLIITQKVDKNDQLLGFFISWIEKLSKKFESILVLCLEKREFDLPENVRVISLGKERGLSKIAWLLNFYKHVFQFRKHYDAVLVHMNPIWMVWGGMVWRLMGKKNYLWYTSGGVTGKLKLAEKLTHTVFTASKESFRLKSKKVVVTGHGVDTQLFSPADYKEANDQLKILSVGRIAPVKNYETLIKAAGTLKERGISFVIDIAGETSSLERDKRYERKVKEEIGYLGLTNYFNFLGKIDHKNLPDYYRTHDLFVHLSKTGSLDKSLLEAMSSGMKVLSSNDWSRQNLPPELIFGEKDHVELADKIEKTAKSKTAGSLRDYVVKNHNLDNLIEKISFIIHEKNH